MAALLMVVAATASPAVAVLPQQSGAVDLLTQANLRLDGAAANDAAGWSVSAAGDVNGDGRDDAVTYGAVPGTVGDPITPLAPTGVARTGTAGFSGSPALPAGLVMDP